MSGPSLLTIRFGRDLCRGEGWELTVIVAPFPPEEQAPGQMIRALVHLSVSFRPRWPFVSVTCYCACRNSGMIE